MEWKIAFALFLFYIRIVQGERSIEPKTCFLSQGIAEPPYTLYKDTPTYKPKIEQLGLTGLP